LIIEPPFLKWLKPEFCAVLDIVPFLSISL
jgi:hypothetical protein